VASRASEQDRAPAEIWREPVRGGYPHPGVASLSGRERLRRFRNLGSPAPPLTHLTGARPTRFGEDTAEAEMPATGWLLNSAGLIGGGTLAVLADIAFGCAFETMIGPGVRYTTAELSLTFLRPAIAGGLLTAHGQTIHGGRTIGLAEAFVLDDDGERMVAHGTSRLSVLAPIEPLPELPDEPARVERAEFATPDPYLRPAPDLAISQDVWNELPGAEILARQLAGELPPPPIHYLTGLRLIEAGERSAAMSMPATEWLNSPSGLLQGGTIAMLADAAMQSAVVATAPAGTAIAGLDLKVNFLRPAMADGRDLVATAALIHAGRTLAITRAEVTNPVGKPIALVTGSSMYLPGRRARLGDVELGEAPGDGPPQ
jgi:uncharacterized protein (TIGR00369 family)